MVYEIFIGICVVGSIVSFVITEVYMIGRRRKRREIDRSIKEAEDADLYEISEHLTSELDLWDDDELWEELKEEKDD